MATSKIDWLTTINPDGTVSHGKVWNPTTGCTKVSAGCKNCYAERIYERFHPGQKFSTVHCIPGRLGDPLHWRKPQRVFVDSMSDLFHEDVPDEFIDHVFARIEVTKKHTYMILTKRPARMLDYMTLWSGKHRDPYTPPGSGLYLSGHFFPMSNVWLGVSVEDQPTADQRIPLLLQTPAAQRFVSYEPALGSLELDFWLKVCKYWKNEDTLPQVPWHPPYPKYWYQPQGLVLASWKQPIDWVICGCESGPGARPMNLEWARSVKDQCQAANVPFFFKQAMNSGKLVHMPELDGKVWDEYPEQKG